MALGTSKTFELLNATTSTGLGTITNVRGTEFLEIELTGMNIVATVTKVAVWGSVYGTTFTTVTVVRRDTNVASDTMSNNAIYSLDVGALGYIRLNVYRYNAASTPTAVGQGINYI